MIYFVTAFSFWWFAQRVRMDIFDSDR